MSEFLEGSESEIRSLNDLVGHLKSGGVDENDIESDGFALDIVPASAGREEAGRDAIQLSSGALTIEQLAAIFSSLPVDLTFVDAEDRVRFISEGPDRVFIRPRVILGRRVQDCHPSSSLESVERILSDFRSGKQDVADFWLEFKGRFVLIRYFALRGEDGAYMGTLEVTQDLTRERGLSGERRLLEYDEESL
jgi:DUF438 domain-containing protein